jgi:hypothetical protein
MRDLPLGTPCIVRWVHELSPAKHLVGHYCEVVAHVYDEKAEYMVFVKSDGQEWRAIRKNLMPIKPDEDLDKVDEKTEDEVTA